MARTKACAYARVSTLLGQDPELQLIQLRQVAAARGFEIVEEFVDHGISGLRESRPALNRLVKAAMEGKFSTVMVVALDRIGRNTRHVLQLMEDFKAYNISLLSLREGLDFSTPTGQMVLTVIAAVSSLERSITAERIKNSLRAKKIAAEQSGSGWRCGRPGLSQDVVDRAKELRREGCSIRGIAKELGIGKTSVERILGRKR